MTQEQEPRDDELKEIEDEPFEGFDDDELDSADDEIDWEDEDEFDSIPGVKPEEEDE